MAELCHLWGVEKTRTTPYRPQANGMVERGNRGLGYALRSLLLDHGQEEWDLLLPQVMRAFRGTPHSVIGETSNYLMLGRELRLPDQLHHHPPQEELDSTNDYVIGLDQRLRTAHAVLRQQQLEIRDGDQDEYLMFTKGDLVLFSNKRRRKGVNPKLHIIGPYEELECYPSHTYKIQQHNKVSVQSERRLKLYTASSHPAGLAPTLTEPVRRPNMRGRGAERMELQREKATLDAHNELQ